MSEEEEQFVLEAKPFVDRQSKMVAPGWTKGVPFSDIAGKEHHACKWPMWGPDKKTGDVCGRHTYEVSPAPRRKESPYCEFHHRKAYPANVAAKK